MLMSDLVQAHNQWASRPADERFETLEDLYLHTLMAATNATTADTVMGKMQVVPVDGDLKLETPGGVLGFNNWSFSQFAQRINAPGGYLATLPAEIAAEALNHGIARNKSVEAQLYFDANTKTARAITSPSYARILNHEVVKGVIEMPGKWTTPPARPVTANQPGSRLATEEDCKSSTLIKPGDWIAPAGIYGSDRDIFIFRVDPETRIDDGTGEGLSRGFFVRNSEVGNSTFELVTFLYRYVCGNHIVWGASNVKSVSIKHIGRTAKTRAFDKMTETVKMYMEQSAKDDTSFIKYAREQELGATYDDVLDLVFGQKKLLPKNKVKAAYDMANNYADIDGSPRSIWGFSQGVTRLSQESPYADERTMLDRAAGSILSMASAGSN
jgi:hypothetical protein